MCLLLNIQLTFKSEVCKYYIHIHITKDKIQLRLSVCMYAIITANP
jgi:hypothetical protein